jgi:dihydrofolate reductase
MRKIITTTFISLDGVMQAPGGPEEDTAGGFAHGGWTFDFWDDPMGEIMDGFMHLPFDLLLGKRTYDIFAAYWPTAKTDQLVAEKFNSTRKYVVSHTPMPLPWEHSFLVSGDVPAEIKKLKQDDRPDLWVHGSGDLIQTLLAHNLVARMHVWTFPITVGSGKRLFAEGTLPQSLKLVEGKISPKGVIIATYEPAGELKTGTVGE